MIGNDSISFNVSIRMKIIHGSGISNSIDERDIKIFRFNNFIRCIGNGCRSFYVGINGLIINVTSIRSICGRIKRLVR
jgi:hypothetical protein